MQRNLNNEKIEMLEKVKFLVGEQKEIANIGTVPVLEPFDDEIIDFLNTLSKNLMSNNESKLYPDIITLGFWMRKSSMLKLKDRFVNEDGNIHLGRGIAFHIAPSNVPVNYAYSLVTGLITGNVNIVRIPSKDFPQVSIINNAINDTLMQYEKLKKYIYLIRYERNQEINELFSDLCDTRIIWGGDNTISELRKSKLNARATEVTFADRYSMAIINSDEYMKYDKKDKIADDFYNDTYLTDQNACTSPRIVIWTGNMKEEAKKVFWTQLYNKVRDKYKYQSIMGVNKLTSSYMVAAIKENVEILEHSDNLIVRVNIKQIDDSIMEFKDNSGYFYEYDCDDIMEIRDICNNTHCQTIGMFGKKDEIEDVLRSGIKGVDRVVPIGKTMDFDLIWDGYNLFERLTRTISVLV